MQNAEPGDPPQPRKRRGAREDTPSRTGRLDAEPSPTLASGAMSPQMSGDCVQLEVDISFVTDEEIAALNAQYRQKPRPTDVLSFAQSEGELFPVPQISNGENSVSLGDIVISIETAQRQARERNHDLATEVSFLVVHGALHLLGYDHIASSDRRLMWRQQDQIIENLGGTSK